MIIIFARRLPGYGQLVAKLRGSVLIIPSAVTGSIENQFIGNADKDGCVSELRDFFESEVFVLSREMNELSPTKRVPLLPIRNFLNANGISLIEAVMEKKESMDDLFTKIRGDFFNPKFRNPKTRALGAFIWSNCIGFQKDGMAHTMQIDTSEDSYPLNLLEAHYRFGLPYEEGFHYDVCREKRNEALGVSFTDVPTGRTSGADEQHVNITPSDAVRPLGQK